MKNIWKLSLAAMLLMGVPSMANAAEQAAGFADEKVVEHEASVLAEMFNWLNKVYASEQDFTEEGFSQFLTDDILFIVNGKESEHGIAAVTERYNKLKARKSHLEVIIPFREEARVGNKVFTYYLNHGWMDSEKPELIVTHVAGYIELKRNKINLLNFISVDVEAET